MTTFLPSFLLNDNNTDNNDMIIITIMINHSASLLVQKTNSAIGPGPVQLKYKQLEGKIALNEISKM